MPSSTCTCSVPAMPSFESTCGGLELNDSLISLLWTATAEIGGLASAVRLLRSASFDSLEDDNGCCEGAGFEA